MWDNAAAAAPAAHGSDDSEHSPTPCKATDKDQEEEKAAEAHVVFKSADPYHVCSPRNRAAAEALMQRTARRRSLFSQGMSLAVGGIAWSADAACLPLLAGLCAVVGMSMYSVARLFRSSPAAARRGWSRPASEAVALLSLNCFLLSVLTYPMLPGVTRAVLRAPRASSVPHTVVGAEGVVAGA